MELTYTNSHYKLYVNSFQVTIMNWLYCLIIYKYIRVWFTIFISNLVFHLKKYICWKIVFIFPDKSQVNITQDLSNFEIWNNWNWVFNLSKIVYFDKKLVS